MARVGGGTEGGGDRQRRRRRVLAWEDEEGGGWRSGRGGAREEEGGGAGGAHTWEGGRQAGALRRCGRGCTGAGVRVAEGAGCFVEWQKSLSWVLGLW